MDAATRLVLVIAGAVALWYWQANKKKSSTTASAPMTNTLTMPIPASFTNGSTTSESFEALLNSILNNPNRSDDAQSLVNAINGVPATPTPMPAPAPQNDPFYYQRRDVLQAANYEMMLGAGGQ